MEKYLYFDLDGTLYNLYKVPNWLERLRANDATVYNEPGYERKSLKKIRAIVSELQEEGWNIVILSWAGIGVKSDDPMYKETYKQKKKWCEKHFPEVEVEDIILSMYGISKAKFAAPRDSNNKSGITHVLIDDNKLVRADWRKAGPNFYTINASRGFVKELQGLLG